MTVLNPEGHYCAVCRGWVLPGKTCRNCQTECEHEWVKEHGTSESYCANCGAGPVAEAVRSPTELANEGEAAIKLSGRPGFHDQPMRDKARAALAELEARANALEEAQQFPVETVMSWRNRADNAERMIRYARALLDPERSDEPDEENALRAYEALSGVPLSVEAGLPAAIRRAEAAERRAEQAEAERNLYADALVGYAEVEEAGIRGDLNDGDLLDAYRTHTRSLAAMDVRAALAASTEEKK